jgi:hypothetical protein
MYHVAKATLFGKFLVCPILIFIGQLIIKKGFSPSERIVVPGYLATGQYKYDT